MDQQKDAQTSDICLPSVPRVLVVIGANTGGPAALAQIIPRLPSDLPASILVIQQIRPGFTSLLAEHLSSMSEMTIRECKNNDILSAGEVLFAPGGYGAFVVKHETLSGKTLHVETENLTGTMEKYRTKVDRAMCSAADTFGSRAIGVVLTGIGNDGREGLKAIRDAGGKTIVQDEATSILFDMPRASINANVVDEVLPLYNIADRITELVGEHYAGFIQKAAG